MPIVILLIVPYGIETIIACDDESYLVTLLIVPYGIETGVVPHELSSEDTFNRTIWN